MKTLGKYVGDSLYPQSHSARPLSTLSRWQEVDDGDVDGCRLATPGKKRAA